MLRGPPHSARDGNAPRSGSMLVRPSSARLFRPATVQRFSAMRRYALLLAVQVGIADGSTPGEFAHGPSVQLVRKALSRNQPRRGKNLSPALLSPWMH